MPALKLKKKGTPFTFLGLEQEVRKNTGRELLS